MPVTDYDAVIIGAGPNGLSAAITLQQQGLSVLVVEAEDTVGGGMRTKELTLPGFKHDVCSAIHPLAAGSPFFQTLPLHEFGLEFLYPEVNAAHPLDNGDAAALFTDLKRTAVELGVDSQRYEQLMQPLVRQWPVLGPQLLGPFRLPANPFILARFGMMGIKPATSLAKTFQTGKARALFAGMAAHAIQPLTNLTTAAFGLVLMIAGHAQGWPMAKGGSQSIADALAGYFRSLGGKIETGTRITALSQLPSSRSIFFDTSPDQLITLAGHRFSSLYRWQLNRYRYGMGVFKIDWALDEPIPFTHEHCRKAGTVHLGSTLSEIADVELRTSRGEHPERPFVLLAQQSITDGTRAPAGKHTAWAYCHVPNGSVNDMTSTIEKQVERYAPGFRDRILARHTMNTEQLHDYNNNYVGGDINGGIINLSQLFTRPALRYSPYRTSAKGIYICSSSTPPGGGVHGMCGYHAARRALKDIFNINLKSIG
jgi:phytoene dehydrogenase-like protein